MLPDGRLQQPTTLGAVVGDALRRWYLEAEKEALRGDVVRKVLLLPFRIAAGVLCGLGLSRLKPMPPGPPATAASNARASSVP